MTIVVRESTPVITLRLSRGDAVSRNLEGLLVYQCTGYVHGGVRPGYLKRDFSGIDQAVVGARGDESGVVLSHGVLLAVDH